MVEPILAGLSVTKAPAFSRAATLSEAAPILSGDKSSIHTEYSARLTLATRDDGTGVTHAPARGRSAAGDETDDGLGAATRFVVLLEVLGRFLLHPATDLANEDDA